jgi:phosphatidylglycerol:prolipoprotein diacylglycerol transferase
MPSPPGRIAFTVFGIDIMWYGILVTLAIAAGVFVVCFRAWKHDHTADTVINFMLFCVPAGLVGARLYYVLFNLGDFSADPMQIFNTRAGGLAIHGALLFGLLTALILFRIWNISPLNGLDLAAPGFAAAQAIGRWGNYFNQEAHGGPTNLPWGIEVGGQTVHPTFLYESLWCFLLFLLLIRVDNRRFFEGQTFLLYCILYSLERFFVEGLRTDSLMLLGTFRQAQVLSAAVFVICGVVYIRLRRRRRYRGRLFY